MPSGRPRGKLSVAAATAVNTLANHLGIHDPFGPVVDDPDRERHAMEALALLADLAADTLAAGVDGGDVRRAWPRVAARVGDRLCGARHPDHPAVRCQRQPFEHPSWHEGQGPPHSAGQPTTYVWPLQVVRPGQARRVAAAVDALLDNPTEPDH
jgi:hypothetical protein